MLAPGAQLGLLFGLLCRLTFPELGVRPVAFAVIGMAALRTGVVRAPATGIVLVMEMTASSPMLLPMLAACFTAMLVPSLLGEPSTISCGTSERFRCDRRAAVARSRGPAGCRQYVQPLARGDLP
jgi:CIC family chloride channel protein